MKNVPLEQKGKHGGRRPGSGRKAGTGTKRKISITVNENILERALQKWDDKTSRLFNHLLAGYVERSVR